MGSEAFILTLIAAVIWFLVSLISYTLFGGVIKPEMPARARIWLAILAGMLFCAVTVFVVIVTTPPPVDPLTVGSGVYPI